MKYGNNNIGKFNKSFIQLKTIQDGQAMELQQIENHKLFLKAVTFMDMLLLTLPESINSYYKQEGKEIPLNGFHFPNRSKGIYHKDHLPTIGTFIPTKLLPSTILNDEEKVISYTTPLLKEIMDAAEGLKPKSKRSAKNDPSYSNPTPAAKQTAEEPPPLNIILQELKTTYTMFKSENFAKIMPKSLIQSKP